MFGGILGGYLGGVWVYFWKVLEVFRGVKPGKNTGKKRIKTIIFNF